jgi:hypothetical protein
MLFMLIKNTHLHQDIWNAVCVKIEPARYASNVDIVTLATASCYQNDHHHKNNNGKESLLMYMVNK